MARINFEDDVEAQDEFWALLNLVNGDRDRALGKLLRFFRLAQEAYGHDKPMSDDLLNSKGFSEMIASGWAVPVKGGYQALGAKKHFAWYRQRCEAGERRAKGPRDKSGRFKAKAPEASSGTPAADQRNSIPHQPLSLSPSLSLSLIKKKEEEKNFTQAEIDRAISVWGLTLKRHSRSRNPKEDEFHILRLLKIHGLTKTLLALLGAGHEDSTPGKYDASKQVRISRLLKPDIFDMFVNFGDQVMTAEAIKKEKALEHERAVAAARVSPLEEWPEQDSEKVREIRAQLDAGLRGAG